MPTPDPGKLFPLPKRDDAPRICVTLQIPGDQESISNFVGAMMRLALWNNYRRDDKKRAKNIAQVWKGIVRDIQFYDCNDAPNGGGGCGDGCGDMCCLRVFEGKLQSLQCGVWTTIDGGDLLALAGPGVQQPPPGGEIEVGDCKEYDVTLYGSNVFYLPVSVEAGNVITISDATGGWSDGDSVGPFGAAWSCPSGQVYALGTCGANNGPSDDDPLPGANHMRLIANIDGTFYDAYNSAITVPTGVTGGQVALQANDPTLSNNLGSITFHIKVCNVAPATFTHTFDYTLSEQGWVPAYDGDQARASYTPTVGWDENGDYETSRLSIIFPAFTPRIFTGAVLTGTEEQGGNLHQTWIYYGSQEVTSTERGPVITLGGAADACSTIRIDMANDSNPHGRAMDGHEISLVVSGMGTDPFLA